MPHYPLDLTFRFCFTVIPPHRSVPIITAGNVSGFVLVCRNIVVSFR